MAGELTGLEAQEGLNRQLATPADEKAGHLLRLSPAVGDFGGQDVPDDDQQLAGDSHDGFFPTDVISQVLELFLSVLIVTDGDSGRLDQDSA
jgi:hypothetical protein